jgi:hypothetical protein
MKLVRTAAKVMRFTEIMSCPDPSFPGHTNYSTATGEPEIAVRIGTDEDCRDYTIKLSASEAEKLIASLTLRLEYARKFAAKPTPSS